VKLGSCVDGEKVHGGSKGVEGSMFASTASDMGGTRMSRTRRKKTPTGRWRRAVQGPLPDLLVGMDVQATDTAADGVELAAEGSLHVIQVN
jgi:hypothetical protein